MEGSKYTETKTAKNTKIRRRTKPTPPKLNPRMVAKSIAI